MSRVKQGEASRAISGRQRHRPLYPSQRPLRLVGSPTPWRPVLQFAAVTEPSCPLFRVPIGVALMSGNSRESPGGFWSQWRCSRPAVTTRVRKYEAIFPSPEMSRLAWLVTHLQIVPLLLACRSSTP